MPKNILLITSDQQHYSTLGSINPKIKTPALDRLADEGVRFDRGYCNNPLCSPSRSSIITGQYPSTHGCWTIGVKLPEDVPTIGDHLTRAGYATHLIGKAHFQPLASKPGSESIECQPTLRNLDFWRKFTGPFYGFQRAEMGRMHTNESHAGQHYAIWMEDNGLKNWADYFDPWPTDRNHKSLPSPGKWDLPEEFHYNNWIAERTVANIEQALSDGKPFLTWASFLDPHYPQVVPDPWYSMYNPDDMEPGQLVDGELDRMPPPHQLTQQEKPDYSWWQEGHGNHGYRSHIKTRDREHMKKLQAVYYGMVSFMDQSVGKILDALDRLGIADDTLVVYSSDHGDYLGQHGLMHKGAFHYEDGIRVPFLVRSPGQVPAGKSSNALQSLVDLSPTFLESLGMEVPGEMQGLSQWNTWRNPDEPTRDHVIVENRHQPTRVHLRTYINERYKITVYRDQPYGELFDFETDPNETHNRWDDDSYKDVKLKLLHEMVNAEIRREPTRMPRIAGA